MPILPLEQTESVMQDQTLKKLAHELDFEIGSIGTILSTLIDTEVLLNQLVVSMNEAIYRGEEMAYYQEHSRKIRVFSELIRYAMNDLSTNYEKAGKTKDRLLEMFYKSEGDKINDRCIGTI